MANFATGTTTASLVTTTFDEPVETIYVQNTGADQTMEVNIAELSDGASDNDTIKPGDYQEYTVKGKGITAVSVKNGDGATTFALGPTVATRA